MDVTALIVKFRPEDGKEEITEKNDVGVGVKAKNAWINFTESIPKHLWKIHNFLPNRRLNGKHIFSKFRLTHNMPAEEIIMTLKESLEGCSTFAKLQHTRYWNVECIGWLHRCIESADCEALKIFFKEILQAKMKKKSIIMCSKEHIQR